MPDGTDRADEDRLAAVARDLGDRIEAALPGWVERSVASVMTAWAGELPDAVRERARAAGQQARREVAPEVRRVLTADVDAAAGTPLAALRSAIRYPTEVLWDAGVPPVVRDEFEERQFPGDLYRLTPASFADVDPDLHEPGLVWGAAKAHVFLSRRRAEGRR